MDKVTYNHICSLYKDCSYYKQLKRLQAENEQLLSALQEIRDIVREQLQDVSEKCINTTPMYSVHRQILDKINLVIGAEE